MNPEVKESFDTMEIDEDKYEKVSAKNVTTQYKKLAREKREREYERNSA